MKILGLDLSLTRTGYARPDGTHGVLVPPKGKDRGLPRIDWIMRRALEMAMEADVTVLEGFSYGSKGSSILDIAQMGGVVRWAMWRKGVVVVELSPSTLKKFATGKGNAPKDQVLAAAIRRLGYQGHDNNEADALFLRLAGLHAYGVEGATPLPQAQLDALGKVQWPKMAVAG
jgi:crossover junction endodeoxyribonuclease RuvC